MLGAEDHALLSKSATDARAALTRLADEYQLSVSIEMQKFSSWMNPLAF